MVEAEEIEENEEDDVIGEPDLGPETGRKFLIPDLIRDARLIMSQPSFNPNSNLN